MSRDQRESQVSHGVSYGSQGSIPGEGHFAGKVTEVRALQKKFYPKDKYLEFHHFLMIFYQFSL